MKAKPTTRHLLYVLTATASLALANLHAQTTNCAPAPAGLVAWWKAEANALDSAGTNTGILQPGVGFTSGQVGQAFYFNGNTNSYIEVPDSPSLELTNELTIEFWVKRLRLTFPSDPYSDYIIEKGGDWTGGTQNYAVALHGASHNYCLHFPFAGGWRGAGSVADTNYWHHCAVVARNNDANPTFYIDGVQQPVTYSEGASVINLYPSTRPLHIGAQLDPVTGWYYFSDTLVDELSLYSRALSAEEIQALYNAGSVGKCTSPLPALITSSPTNQTVAAGSAATFVVGAAGTSPLSYQWVFGNLPLAGQTQASLVLSAVQPAQAGSYFVVVTNIYGAATSAVAVLTVLTFPPTITVQPQGGNAYVGTSATLSVSAAGTPPLSYKWNKNGAPLSGATTSAYTILSAQLTDSGTYSVVVTNLYGSITSSPAVLAVRVPPPCDPPPAGLVSWWRAENDLLDAWGNNNGVAGYASYSVTYAAGKVGRAFSFSGSALQYIRVPEALSLHFPDALTIEAWVSPSDPQTSSSRTIVAKRDYSVFGLIMNVTNSSFTLGTTNNGALYLTVSPRNSGRTNVTLVTPTPLPVSQWSHVAATYDGAALRLYINGSLAAHTNYSAGIFPGTADLGIGAIPGASAEGASGEGSLPWVGALDELSLYSRALSDAEILALYNADVSGKCLVPPAIVVQPQSRAIPLGEDVLFSPVLQGTKPMGYQWRFNGQNLFGATSATLLLEKVQSNRIGSYSVMVTNVLGRILSSNALLTLLPPPVCVSPPLGMLSWWPADGSPVDAAGTNNALVYYPSSASYLTGKVSRAFNLTNYTPELNSLFYAPNSPSLNFGSNADFSIETWIKYLPPSLLTIPPYRIAPGPIQTIVAKQAAKLLQPPVFITTAPNGYSLLLNQGRLACWLGAAAGRITNSATFISNGPDLRDGMFHHVALTLNRDATNGGNLYVDGQVVLTFDPTPMMGSLSNSAAFGIGSGDTPFYGLIDELTLYGRALTAAEVLAIRQAGAAGKCKVLPYILTQPTNQFVNLGANATFSVAAAGSGLLHYQWRFNSVPISSATSSSLTVSNAAQAGTYSVQVTNAFGSVLSASASLTVNHPPVARCLNVIAAAGPDCLASASVDNHSYDPDQNPITLSQTPPGPYPPGTNFVTLTATDSHGLSNSCTALVLVVDQTPPVIVCPPSVVQPNDLNQCGAVVTYALPSATDLCSAVTNLTCVPPPGSFFPVGTTLVRCSAVDAAGNLGTNSFTVTVKDTQAPVITCPADLVVTNAHDAWTSLVTFNPVVTDNCPGVGLPVCNPASGSAFSLGVHRVTCSVTDAASNTNQCSFNVTVRPGNQPPVPVIHVAPLAKFPGNTNLLVVAPVCASNATVYLDGSKSYDPDDATFNYYWFEGTNCFSTSAVATNRLSLGCHDILLWLDDTFPLGTNSAVVTVDILSPVQAVGMVSNLVNNSTLQPNRQHPLQASLNAAADALGRCDLNAGLNQLQAFENKVSAQVAPSDPALADALTRAADQMINTLSPSNVARGPDLSLQSLDRQPDGKVRMKFIGKTIRVPLVQASINLKDWTTIGIATDNGDGSFAFEDAQAARLSDRFYRVISP
jgi:Concanavalin A-like lectin/glucanases superfamily/HYR domain/Immunoglobulin domain/Immunoglobulin I-set domain